ncbi:unnamed protein product [Ectocarpus sp. CCAP 1310/34]|nr:unnamed protein product [Ectocarpus sp. CCAP 1310/34]
MAASRVIRDFLFLTNSRSRCTELTQEGEQVTTAIEDFVPPDSHEIVPKSDRSISNIYKYGVKVKHNPSGKWFFACFGSACCRANLAAGIFIAIGEKSVSNANDHIKEARRRRVMLPSSLDFCCHWFDFQEDCSREGEDKNRLDLRVSKAVSSAMYTRAHPRFLAMKWVKCNMIEGFCPVSHGEKEWVRASLKLTALKNFPITGIHNEAVKQMVVEMYAATASQFKMEMAAQIGGMRLLHLSLDLWVDKFSSLKYVGIPLFYVDRTWVLRSRLIAVRQFNPTKELLEDNRLSALVQKHLESVLEEYGLDVSLVFSATSDSGSDVKRLCDVLLPGLWEWCVCHMINCALVEAFGTHVDSAKSRNPGARKVITMGKKVVEHIPKSPRAKAIFEQEQVRQYAQCYHRKLVNAAPQRWSGVTNVLEAVIVNRAAVNAVYTTEGKDSPLTSLTNEIDEL